jgi:hypothetical protein
MVFTFRHTCGGNAAVPLGELQVWWSYPLVLAPTSEKGAISHVH